jgi:hypothetical protein
MLNLMLFVVNFILLSLASWLFGIGSVLEGNIIDIIYVVLLVTPFSIDGNIYTVFGSAKNNHAQKSIFSLMSLYQESELDVVSVFGSLYQKAGHSAGIVVGIAV